jgi:hypothetical protein
MIIDNKIQSLNTSVKGLSSTLSTNGVSNVITPYKGDPAKSKDWIKSIEKYAYMNELHHDKVRKISFGSSRGAVSDFIQRSIANNPAGTWPTLKAELSSRFSEVTD